MKNIMIFVLCCGAALVCSLVSCSPDKGDPSSYRNRLEMMPLLEKFALPKNVFPIDPSVENTVTGKKGIRLVIPPDVFDLPSGFRKGGKVDVELTEVLDRFDFIVSGVGLSYTGMGGIPMLFESAGMYNVGAAYEGKKIALKAGKTITVQMPDIVPGEEFGMYRMNGSWEWEHHGHNQEAWGGDRPIMSSGARKEAMVIRASVIGVRIYEIDTLAWWNCDYPATQIIFLNGIIANAGDDQYSQVMAFSLSARGVFSEFVKGKSFRIRAVQNHRMRILVITKDNRIALSDPFIAPAGKEMRVKNLVLKEIDPETVKDRNKFERFLGLTGEKHSVQYRQKKN
jgi:hypothetical protein